MSDQEAKIKITAEDAASPVVQQAAQAMTQFKSTIDDVSQATQGAGDSTLNIVKYWEQEQQTVEQLNPAFREHVSYLKDIDNGEKDLAQSMQQVGNSAAGSGEAMGAFSLGMVGSIAAGMGLATTLQSVVSGLVSFVESSNEVAGQMQIFQTKAEVLFGADLPNMQAAIGGMATEFHRSKSEMEGFVTSADMFTTSMGMGKTQAEEMSLGMADLAVQIGQAQGSSEQEGFNQLERALRGNGRALVDLGIDLNAHRLQEYMDTEGIKGKFTALTDASKATVAYHYLLTQEGPLAAMAAKNQDGYAEATKRLGGAWQDLELSIGKLSVEPATGMLQGLTGVVNTLTGEVTTATKSWMGFMSVVGDVATFNLNKVAEDFGSQVGKNMMGVRAPTPLTPEGAQSQDEFYTKTLHLTKAQVEAAKAGEAWKASLDALPGAAGGASKKADELRSSLDSLSGKYDDTTQNITNKLNDLDNAHKDKMTSYEDSMSRLEDSLTTLDETYADKVSSIQDTLGNLKSSFEDAMSGITQSEEDALAKQGDKIDKLKQKLEDLQLRAYQENKKGSVSAQTNTDIERTQAELDKEQKSHDTQMAKMTPDQKTFIAGREDMTETDRAIADKEREKLQKTEKFNADVAKQQDNALKDAKNYAKDKAKIDGDVSALQGKIDVEKYAYGLSRSEIVQTQSQLLGFKDQLDFAMNHMGTITKTQLKSMSDDLADFGKTLDKGTAQLDAKNYEDSHKKKTQDAHAVVRGEHQKTADSIDSLSTTYSTQIDLMATNSEKGVKRMQDALKALQTTDAQIQAEIAAENAALAKNAQSDNTGSNNNGNNGSNNTQPTPSVDPNAAGYALTDPSLNYYNAARDGSQGALMFPANYARSQAVQNVNLEIQMGQVHVNSQADINRLVDTMVGVITRHMQLHQQGVN